MTVTTQIKLKKESDVMNFLECYDSKTKELLLQEGFKLMHERCDSNGQSVWVFAQNRNIDNLKFSKVDKSKFRQTNILKF